MKAKMVVFCKMALTIVLVAGMFFGNYQMVNAGGKTDEIAETSEAVEFVDENGEVIAVFTPYSENNPAPHQGGMAH